MVNPFWIKLKKDGADKLLIHLNYFPQKYKLAVLNYPKHTLFINIYDNLFRYHY